MSFMLLQCGCFSPLSPLLLLNLASTGFYVQGGEEVS